MNLPVDNSPSGKPENAGLLAWLKKLLPAKNDNNSLREAIEELIEETGDSHQESAGALHERKLLSNILQLRDLPVVDMMVPRANIVAIDVETSKEDLYKLLAHKPHSRIPVYRGDMDNIIGAIHMKDIVANLANAEGFELRDIMRDVLVVSPAMRVMDLFLQMRQSKVHMAIVIDEFGGVDGIVTINDLIEAVVGEIDDEFDFDIEPQLIERPDGSVLADARFAISDFEGRFGQILSEEEREEVDTLGGLITSIEGRVPTRGEIVRHDSGMEFEIVDADPRRVTRLRIRNLPKKTENGEKD